MRIVFMGTPEFAVPCLKALLSAEHDVAAVYTQPDRPAGRGQRATIGPVKGLALSRGVTVVQPARLREPAEVERLAALAPEVIVVAAYGQLLPQMVLDIPPLGCINVHPSLLPRHRGPSPIASAILEGDSVTGVSIMFMDTGMDTGPILSQRETAVSGEDTTGSLQTKLAEISGPLLIETLDRWAKRLIQPVPQDHRLATFSSMVKKEDGEIDWSLPARQIWRRVRAFQPWPGCYSWWRGRMLKVLTAVPIESEGKGNPGTVVMLPGGTSGVEVIGVVTGTGVLGLLKVQPEGRQAMGAEEFARGQHSFLGSVLPLRSR